MVLLFLLPALFSFLILGAHYLREGSYLLVVLCLITPLLLLIRRRPILRALQGLLVMTLLVWALTAYDVMQERMAQGQPFLRAGAILLAVGLFALLAALFCQSRRVKAHYPWGPADIPPELPQPPKSTAAAPAPGATQRDVLV